MVLISILRASPAFKRTIATARPTAERFPHVPFELWPIEEFTYLSPSRFADGTQDDRKPHAESYWKKGDAVMIDEPGAESLRHLLGAQMRCSTGSLIMMPKKYMANSSEALRG